MSPDLQATETQSEVQRLIDQATSLIAASRTKWEVAIPVLELSARDARSGALPTLGILSKAVSLCMTAPAGLLELVEEYLRRIQSGIILFVPEASESKYHALGRGLLSDTSKFIDALSQTARTSFPSYINEFGAWFSEASALRTEASASRAALEELHRLGQAEEAAAKAEAAAAQATEAAATVSDTANKVGTESLSEHFNELARSEQRRASLTQALTAGIVLIVVAVGAYGAFLQKLPTAWSAEAIVKMTLSLPMLALAYYFAREASRHSLAAQRAREIDVRLRTIRSYTVELPEAERIAIRSEFAKSLFSVLDWNTENGKEANALGKEMADAARAVSDAVTAAAGRART